MNKTFLLIALFAVSCATVKKDNVVSPPQKETQTVVAPEIPKPSEEQKFDEVGLSSWYGEQFHNKPTASGELFDRFKLTAAHRTLPFGTSVKVQNLDNQKETLVRINDRGPYNKARIIDVSERAAEILDFKEVGVARVGLTVVRETNEANLAKSTTSEDSTVTSPVRDDDTFSLDDDEDEEEDEDDEDLLSPPKKDQKKPITNPIPEKKTAPTTKTVPSKTTESKPAKSEPEEKEKPSKVNGQPKGFTVQIGVFKEKRRADNFKAQVAANFKEEIYIFNRAGTFVVQIGDFATRAEAVALRDKLKSKGIFGFIPPK